MPDATTDRRLLPATCSGCGGPMKSYLDEPLCRPCRRLRPKGKPQGKKPDTPCAGCGKLLYSSPSSLPAGLRRCHDCRRANPTRPPVAPCEWCGEDFQPQKRRVRFCSKACKYAARVTRPQQAVCAYCGETFTHSAKSQDCCSQRCAARLRAGWSTCTDLVHAPRPDACGLPAAHPARRQPTRTWWTYIASGHCRRCGDTFTAPANTDDIPAYCSARCLRADAKDRRRARKRDAYITDVRRSDIIERDHGRCQLCGRKVDQTKVAPHPRSPTLDHIIPLANGGTHEPANVQLAHFLCNSIKSNRGTGDQLRLIG